ncbi:MAG TPA: hypothetical protein OIM35_05840 [Clostridiaceae bacterium]|nr:hypothetical protein [Clostridiaceae bacterium]
MKNKKILIIPIVIIILLVALAGVSAFLYFKTDLFKSPKQLFFKYLGESVSSTKNFNYDKSLANYKELSQKSSKSTGEITGSITDNSSNTSSSSKSIEDAINNSKIEYSIESIPSKNKYHASIKPNYNDSEITNLELLADNDSYGAKCTDLYDKYVYFENNNLKTLVSKFGIDSKYIPDKFEKVDIYELLNISADSRTQIVDRYQKLLDSKLTKDMFTSNKKVTTSVNGTNVKANAYTLTINGEHAYDILLSFFQTLKDDDQTLDLIIEKCEKSGVTKAYETQENIQSSIYSISSDNNDDEIQITFTKDSLKDDIQTLIESLQDSKDNFSADESVQIIVYSYKGKTAKIEFKNGSDETSAFSIEITHNKSEEIITLNSDDTTYIKANYSSSKKEEKATIVLYEDNDTEFANLYIEHKKDKNKINFKINDSSNSVLELNIDSNGQIGKGTIETVCNLKFKEEDDLEINLNLNNSTTYTDDINIDDLSSNNGELLNTISNTKMNDLYKEIYSNLQKVLPEKAKLLGIDLPKDILSKLDPDADKKTITEKDLTGYTVYKDSTTRNTICLS